MNNTKEHEEANQAMPIVVLSTPTYKRRLKSEASAHGKALSEYTRLLLDLGRKAVAANPDLLNEV